MNGQTLIIACGNPLRSDDGVARAAADIVQSWQLPRVKVLSVHQLVPELIEDMKQADRVLFMDAGMNIEDHEFNVLEVEPSASRRTFGHFETPAQLLAIMLELEGRTPPAWLVSIATHSFEHGDVLTEATRQHMQAALAWVGEFLAEPICTKSA